MPQHVVLCVDVDKNTQRQLQSILKAYEYSVLTASDVREALDVAAAREVNAVILDCPLLDMRAEEAASALKQIRPNSVVIAFAEAGDLSARQYRQVDASVDKNAGPHALLPILQRVLAKSAAELRETRKFVRYSVQLPFEITVYRAGKLAVLQGQCSDFGEGGIGGMINGDLEPGECVLVLISSTHMAAPLEPRAQVRYRKHSKYGFAFFDITSAERAKVRQLCAELAHS